MTDTEILHQMIQKTALVDILSNEYEKPYIVLSEPQTPNSSVTILQPPNDAVIIKGDAFRSPDSIFNGKHGECKRADYIIISAEKKCIIYIELKKTKDNFSEIVKQLKGSQCFVKYCQEIGNVFWNKRDFLSGYKSRFLSINHISVNKGKTRIDRKNRLHDTPEKAMKINRPGRLQFNHVAGLG